MTREEYLEKFIQFQRENDLTQKELAQILDVPVGTVQNWCSRRRLPNYENMLKIKNLLELE